VVRIARIVVLAVNVFGSREKGLLWLRSSDDRIGNRNPISLLQTESGGRLVESMLWAIDQGIFT
jgi:putative toxin-antitoxin system antitoxin component (TIGR02293 family)